MKMQYITHSQQFNRHEILFFTPKTGYDCKQVSNIKHLISNASKEHENQINASDVVAKEHWERFQRIVANRKR